MEEFSAAGDHLYSAIRRYESASGGLGMSLEWPTFINRFREVPAAIQHSPPEHPLPDTAAPQQFDHVSIPKTSFAARLLTPMPTPDLPNQLVVQPRPNEIPRHQPRVASIGAAKKPPSWKPAREKKSPPAKGKRIKPSSTKKKAPVRSKPIVTAPAAQTSAPIVCYDCDLDYTSGSWRYHLEFDPLPGPTCSACYQTRRRAKRKLHPELYLELSEDDSDAVDVTTTTDAAQASAVAGPSRAMRVSGPSPPPAVPGPSMSAP
ncbi:hypothetical protein A4X13_0g4688 [Tilletia indica]|uniref:Uncharacterized protein n=1 Tax=Tilletia indica TaxID=43049 RepID=A0A177TQI0_9BASI|nr:hypothetical protein A4X13_0g4688 [Tilletia indica]